MLPHRATTLWLTSRGRRGAWHSDRRTGGWIHHRLSFGDVKVRSARSCTPRRASRSVKFAPRRCGATRATQRRRAPTSVSAGDPAKSSSTGRHPWPSPMRSSNGSHRSWRPRTAGRSTVRRQTSVPPPDRARGARAPLPGWGQRTAGSPECARVHRARPSVCTISPNVTASITQSCGGRAQRAGPEIPEPEHMFG
jgi:hypothetical protein